MTQTFVPSDTQLLDLLRQGEERTVAELAESLQVTSTAVRQRLNRLLGQGLIGRAQVRESGGRGRPVHRYFLTTSGRRKAGANFADLAIVMWEELREIKDPEVRKGLLKRISTRMAAIYSGLVTGGNIEEKMESLAELFSSRQLPFEVSQTSGELPILTALACPYPGLAEQDRSVCAMERILISEVVGQDVRLSRCRLDGDSCCTFEPKELATPEGMIEAAPGI